MNAGRTRYALVTFVSTIWGTETLHGILLIPRLAHCSNALVTADGYIQILRNAFQRVSILSNEKFRGVRLNLANGLLKITANNPEQEEAEEIVEVMYEGDELEIGFNVSYVLDVLNTLKTEDVLFTLADSNSSALIEGAGDEEAMYVVMPMRL